MKAFAIGLLAAFLSIFWQGTAHAYYFTITTTGYYSIALDGEYVWGGSSSWATGWSNPAPKANVWRYRPSDGTFQKWALPDAVGMQGTVAGIVPLADQVLVLISGSGWSGTGGRPSAPDATYSFGPLRSVDGGIASYNRDAGTWSILEIPVYDIQGYTLRGNDLWLSCGDQNNPRVFRAYRYNVVSKQLDPVAEMSDSHVIAISPDHDRGFTGTHHGRGLESFALSSMKFSASTLGDAPELPITEQVIDVDVPAPDPPLASTFTQPHLGLIAALLPVDNQLWVFDTQGAFYAGRIGGLVLYELPSMKMKWASPSTWHGRDFGDTTRLNLNLDPVDNTIIWAANAKGLFKVHRTESPPRVEQIDIDGLLDHNFQHIAVDAESIWAGTEQGYLYSYDKSSGVWSLCGNWQTGFTSPVVVGQRQVPGSVESPTSAATGNQVNLTWQNSASPSASSYFVSRDDVLIGLTETATFEDPNAPSGSHTYTVVPNEAPYLKGGLLGPGAGTTVSVDGTTATALDCSSRPDKIQWGLGEMAYIAPSDLYVDVYEFPNTQGTYPMTAVTWPQAKQLAAWQGKHLPTHEEYAVIALGPDGVSWDPFYTHMEFRAQKFEPSGALDNSVSWGLYDLPGNVMEWLDAYSPLGDGQTYGLAAGGSYPEVTFDWRDYAPYAEYPIDSWARDINRYNHSEIGFRCALSGVQAMHLLNPTCPADPDAIAPQPPPISEGGAGGNAGSDGVGGTPGSGGGAGTGTMGGSANAAGGAGGASAGNAASAGSAAERSAPRDTFDTGCACRVVPQRNPSRVQFLVMLAALAAVARRRRATTTLRRR